MPVFEGLTIGLERTNKSNENPMTKLYFTYLHMYNIYGRIIFVITFFMMRQTVSKYDFQVKLIDIGLGGCSRIAGVPSIYAMSVERLPDTSTSCQNV